MKGEVLQLIIYKINVRKFINIYYLFLITDGNQEVEIKEKEIV